MGICLDIEQNNEELETAERSRGSTRQTSPMGAGFPMQNSSHVKFEPPNVPVIFVLGGPGSGKVTHCDNLMQERRGLVHINMTDLLQQYAIGNDMQDFGTLSSKTVTEVLMLEMKMAPTAKTFLVSGYPRSMRDVAEYSDKVNGERNPDEVYKDFRAAVLQILTSVEDQDMNGGIPGEIVGVEPAPTRNQTEFQDIDVEDMPVPTRPMPIVPPNVPQSIPHALPQSMPKVLAVNGVDHVNSRPEVIRVRGTAIATPTLWVVGGPGSNKAALCQRAVTQRHGWTHFSLGQRLRILADAGGGPVSDGALSRAAISGGELAPNDLVTKLVTAAAVDAARSGHGLLLDGYPRDVDQMDWYQNEFKVQPRMVLLDCSKLQLGRGRRDDSVAAFRRRLEVFRELSLPMLKKLDQQHRLVIVDGDTESEDVQAEFTRVLLEEMEKAEALAEIPQPEYSTPNEAMSQFTHAISRMGAGLTNGISNGTHKAVPNGNVGNGFIGISNNKVKPLVNMTRIPSVSQMTQDDVRRLYEQSSGDITVNTHI
ncbi:uncharacterized protein LOC110992321 isoform X3 [Pieris rapae]|uniref:uncharacterized protein LOC110992321 isoform X3 n=1 Tax=Pieris rapae TaxID=64459 RepID=UPI001E27D08F|nr:uncharacterized protein LOC110992321 isoform X3 [Pieris rapae]